VVLNPSTPVLEAARAIESNNIGAVVVQNRGRVVGIVTDRDLTIRVLGRALDPRTTTLSEVMTTDVATLTPADSQSDAIRLMQERNCRRIPLVEEDRLVGMVTLDDLLLDEIAPIDELAAIVEAQIGEGGPAASARSPARLRSLARAQATHARLVAQVRDEAELETAEQADLALEVVLTSVVRRLTSDEAEDLMAQLPSLLRSRLQSLPPGPDKLITRAGIEAELAQRLEVDDARAADVLSVVGSIITRNVSRGQMDDVRVQLPAELRDIFPAAPGSAASTTQPAAPVRERFQRAPDRHGAGGSEPERPAPP
jgi:uncharacterized protein (DUF2267 family)/predicted transcriptional regulator